jgi:hypothetical protein
MLRGVSLMARRPKNLSIKTMDYLRFHIDRDPYIHHVGREVLEMAIQVIQDARTMEDACINRAEELQAQDKARAVRLWMNISRCGGWRYVVE